MPFEKRVLFVQPDTELVYARKEAEQVINLLDANVLQGSVHLDDLIERVHSFQPQLIIFSTHGKEEGILLSDGIIGADLLKPILTTAPVEAVYLNTCESFMTASMIHDQLPVFFAFNVTDVPDRNAFVAMSTFAYHLDKGLSYHKALSKAKSAGNPGLLFLPNMAELHMANGNGNGNGKPKLNGNGRLENLHDTVVELGYLVYGNDKWKLPGLVNTVETLQKDVSFIKTATSLIAILMVIMLVVIILAWITM